MIVSIVPISPVFCPACSKTARIIYVVVVFPLVPVIPIVVNSSAGYPKYAADISANASLVLSNLITVKLSGTSTSFSTTIAAAPSSAACAANLCPSKAAPLIHTNTLPFSIFLESYTNVEISTSSLPCTRVYSERSNNSFNIMFYLQ